MGFREFFIVAALVCLGTDAEAATIDCPTPTSPENGQIFYYQGGMTVKYACDPGYTLHGEVFAYCREKEWSSEAPKCVSDEDSPALPSSRNSEAQEKTPYSRPLFSWDQEKDNITVNNGSGMLQDEPRIHMVLYPERRIQTPRVARIRTAAVRVQSATELEEEQRKRSQKEKATPKPETPSIIYVRKALTPGKVVIQENALRRQYEIAALHLAGDPDPDVAVVPVPRAAVSTDDKGGQSDEALRHMYIMAQNYMYPRQAVADPNLSPVVLTLSDSQIMWINSLHPDLRERYLRDLYNTRAKEAEEGARAQEFLRRYEDAYHVLYNRPYYVRQPVAVMVEDPVTSYDYSCYQADSRGRANLIRPPRVPNAQVTFYRRNNGSPPHNAYLSAVYRCDHGFRMRDNRFDELHCSRRAWLGQRPICDRIDTNPCTDFGCSHTCQDVSGAAHCICPSGFALAADRRTCQGIAECPKDYYGCSHSCQEVSDQVHCTCPRGFALASDGRTCQAIAECPKDYYGCSHSCQEVSGRVHCTCPSGFALASDGRTCQAIAECPKDYYGCSHSCQEVSGRVHCTCPSGFALASDGRTCQALSQPVDANRPNVKSCSVENGGCEQMCLSHSNGAFERCGCRRYFRLAPDMHSCISTIKECGNYGCSHTCQMHNGIPHCFCPSGFTLASDRKTCGAMKECSKDDLGCSHECQIRGGKPHCTCPKGFALSSDRKTCRDIDECANRGTHRCTYHNCVNTIGSYMCSCSPGYERTENNICVDIDECSQDDYGCSHQCVNVRGSAYCRCPAGFVLSLDGKTCEDKDECASERTNLCHHKCTNTVGSYVCSCLPGYLKLENHTCVGCPKNSFMSEPGSCQDCPSNSHTAGEGMTSLDDCTCDSGYTGNPAQGNPCTDIDECELGNFGCSGECINTPGSAHCFCPVGFEVMSDEKTCVDIDECAIKNGGCQITCINTVGSFNCSCSEGYTTSTVDAYSCIDTDECSEKNGGCSHICNNFPGGYYCSCGVGYRLDTSQKVCSAVTCPQIAVPHNARLLCTSSKGGGNNVPLVTIEIPYNTTCTFKCHKGYKLSFPTGKISCSEDGSWKGKIPECVALTCPPIGAPENGNVEPPSCVTQGGEVLEKCYFTCRAGFHLVGNPVFTCQRTRSWKPEQFPSCQPIRVLPHVACLPDVNVELPKGKDAMEVEILHPESNMDLDHITVSPSWVKYGKVTFPAGTTDVVYTAESSTAPNVTSACTRTVKVIDAEPPTVVFCPPSFSVDSATNPDENTLITWDDPKFEDNVGVVSVITTMEPNSTLTPGVHFVQYTAKDAAGNIADCVFSINVTGVECKDPAGPLNGASNCLDWMHGRICEPECHPGYVFYFPEAAFYTCDGSGVWSPSDTIQDCAKFFPANSFECAAGTEWRIDDDTGDKICVECPSSMSWSNVTKTCVKIDSSVDDN